MTTLWEQVLCLHKFCIPFTQAGLDPAWRLCKCWLHPSLFLCCPWISPTIIQLLPRKPEPFQKQRRLDGEPGSLALLPKERLGTGFWATHLALSLFFILCQLRTYCGPGILPGTGCTEMNNSVGVTVLCEWPIWCETHKYRITTPGLGTEGAMRETTKANRI